MAEFIKQEDYDQLPEEEKKDVKIKALKGLEAFLMFIEFCAMCVYCYFSVIDRFTGDDIISEISKFVIIGALFAISSLLVIVQQVVFAEMVKSFTTQFIKDDILTVIGFIAVTSVICYLDWQGAEMAFKHVRPYKPQEKTVKNDDTHIAASSRKLSNIEREATARKKAESDLKNCIKCDAIKTRYETKIKPHKKSSNPAWVKSINQTIDRQNEDTKKLRDAEIAEAKANLAEENNKIISDIVSEVSSADSQVSYATTVIVEHNKKEEKKGEEREEQNEKFAFLVTPITQPLLLIFRIMLILIYRKMGYTIHQSAGLLRLSGVLSALFRPANIFADEMVERLEIWRVSLEVASVNRMITHKATVVSAHGSEFKAAFNSNHPLSRSVLKMMATGSRQSHSEESREVEGSFEIEEEESLSFSEDESVNPVKETGEDSSKIIEEIEEKVGFYDGTLSESSEIEDLESIISDCEMLLGRASTEDSAEIFSIISDCKLLLKRLKG